MLGYHSSVSPLSARWMDMSPEPDDNADYDEWSVEEE